MQLAAAFGCGILVANVGGGDQPAAAVRGQEGRRETATAATSNDEPPSRRLQTGESCATNFGRESSDRSPWDRLSSSEKSLVSQALQSGLNLDMYDSDPFEVDAVRAYDVDEPDKAAMLEYLDNEGPEPPRYARAWVYHGAGDDDYSLFINCK